MKGFKNEAEGYAASLRQQAHWIFEGDIALDPDELEAAAAFIERQQSELDKLLAERHELAEMCGIRPARVA